MEICGLIVHPLSKQMLSLEGYTEVIEVVSKQVGFYSPLFIIFYLFFGQIVLTLFVGVVIEVGFGLALCLLKSL